MHAIIYSPCKDFAVQARALENNEVMLELFEDVGMGVYFMHDADGIAYGISDMLGKSNAQLFADYILYTADNLPGEAHKSECRDAQTLRDWAHSLA